MTAPAVSTFPTAIDTWTLPKADDTLASPNVEHDLIHDSALDAIRKIEIELGIASSPDIGSVDYKLSHHTHQGTDGSAKFASVPIQMVASQVPNPLEVKTSGGALVSAITPAGEFLDVGATSTTLAYRSYVTGDTFDRYKVQADGKTSWGSGAAATDTSAYRVGVGLLRIDNQLGVGMTPTVPLDVSGVARASGDIRGLTDVYAQYGGANQVRAGIVGGGAAAGVEFSSASNYIGTVATNVVGIAAGGTTVARFYNNGEMAIGTTNAGGTYRLTVLGPSGSNPPVYLRSTAGSTGDGNYQINLSHTGDAIGGWLVGHEGVNNGKLKFAWEAGSGPGDRMTLDNAGIVRLTAGATSFSPIILDPNVKQIILQGDISNLFGYDTAGNTRWLMGLRTDVAGNSTDLVTYTYAGNIRWFPGSQEKLKLDTAGALTVFGQLKAQGVGGVPRLYLKATDGPVDQKVWDVLPLSGTMIFRSLNDAETTSQTVFTLYPTSAAGQTQMAVVASGVGLARVNFGTALGAAANGVPAGGRILYI